MNALAQQIWDMGTAMNKAFAATVASAEPAEPAEHKEPVSRSFNVAVNQIAGRLMPCGFDVAGVAPDSLDQLNRVIEDSGRMLVWDGASESTIFADPETNYAFRAWHDWCHHKGQFAFDREGERQAAEMQCEHIRELYGNSRLSSYMQRLVKAEVLGQAEYFDIHGKFPENQRAFDLAYIKDPKSAIHQQF